MDKKRREFLRNLELVGIGRVAGGVLAPVITSCGGGSGATTSSQANAEQSTQLQQLRLPSPPFPYKELNPKSC
ncbi:MAG: hypothetical protein DSZ26_00570 [Thermovibrio sp.]|nr:MAG: hypothetical protein DSZ26_00570 [Thermovibrio sp.]